MFNIKRPLSYNIAYGPVFETLMKQRSRQKKTKQNLILKYLFNKNNTV